MGKSTVQVRVWITAPHEKLGVAAQTCDPILGEGQGEGKGLDGTGQKDCGSLLAVSLAPGLKGIMWRMIEQGT